MRLSLVALAAFALGTATPSLAKTTNCRQCDAYVALVGEHPPGRVDEVMKVAVNTFTGGDYLDWIKIPEEKNAWSGEAKFHRLCGNGPNVNHHWTINHFDTGPTTVYIGSKKCGKAVRCHDGSQCEKSGIGT